MITPCACLGPQCGEQYCPCVMETYELERSDEWKNRNSPEQLAKDRTELASAFKQIFDDGVKE